MAVSRKTTVRLIVLILIVLLLVGLGIAVAVSSRRKVVTNKTNSGTNNTGTNNTLDNGVVPGWKAVIKPENKTYKSLVDQQRWSNRDLSENDSPEVATCRNMNMYISQSVFRRLLGLENNPDTGPTQVKQEWPAGELVKCFMVVDNSCYLYSDTETCVSSGEKKYVDGGHENYQQNVLYKRI